jgi:hypothetical protein
VKRSRTLIERTDLDIRGWAGARGAAAGEEYSGRTAAGAGQGGPEVAEVGEVVVPVVGEAEIQDLAAGVVGEGASGGGGGGPRAVTVAVVVREAGDGVRVVVDPDEDAVGGARARAEAERGGVAGLAVATSSHGGGGGGVRECQGEALRNRGGGDEHETRTRWMGQAVISDPFCGVLGWASISRFR